MKKMLFSLSVLLASTYALATVESQVVGYNTIEVNKKYTLVAVNFEGIENESLSIQEAFPYADGMTKGNSVANADALQILNASGGYDTYFLSNGTNAKSQTVPGLEGKWSTASYAAATASLPTGTPAWYVAQNNTISASAKVTVAGQVAEDATKTKIVKPGVNLIANPYAADMGLNSSIPYTEGMVQGNSTTNADVIQIMTASGGYDTYFLSNGLNAKSQTVPGLEGKWSTSTFSPTTASIGIGSSAWYVSKGTTPDGFELVIEKPYAL